MTAKDVEQKNVEGKRQGEASRKDVEAKAIEL